MKIQYINSFVHPSIGTDYTIDSSLTVPIAASNSGGRYCLDVSTIQDNIAEGTEQFELYFENLPSEFATAGMRDTVCVSIVDDEGISTHAQCGCLRIQMA